MPADFNKVILIGNLTAAPELRYTPNGTAVADLRLAVNHRYTSQGERHEEALFITAVVWAKQAEACAEYLDKGSKVLVEGRLRLRQWEKDGQKRSVIEAVAEHVQFQDRKPLGQATVPASAAAPADGHADTDDVPF